MEKWFLARSTPGDPSVVDSNQQNCLLPHKMVSTPPPNHYPMRPTLFFPHDIGPNVNICLRIGFLFAAWEKRRRGEESVLPGITGRILNRTRDFPEFSRDFFSFSSSFLQSSWKSDASLR